MSPLRLRRAQRKGYAAPTSIHGDRPLSVHHYRARVRTLISACIIGVVLALVSAQRLRSSHLPSTYAVCSREHNFIYTVDLNEPTIQCVVVSNDLVADRGSVEEIRSRWEDQNRDLTGPLSQLRWPWTRFFRFGIRIYYLEPGEAMYPGFADAHAHILGYGQSKQLPLYGSSSAEDVVGRTTSYVLNHTDILKDPSIWIEGQGWDQNVWPNQAYPTATDLEVDVLRERPIVLYRVDVHALWVSRKVLDLLDPLPEKVEGGEIVRNADGRPTGVFIDNAMLLVEAIKPAWNDKEMLTFFRTAMGDAVRFGLTSIHDASTFPFMLDFFKRMADRRLLPIRLYPMVHLDDSTYWGDKFERFQHSSGKLTVKSVKLFTDGALGSSGAALLEPYSDQPTTQGILIYPEDTITELVEHFVKHGWQTNVHCIGDRANQIVLNAFERAVTLWNSSSSGRHRIEHAQILTQRDILRFSELDIVPSMQPTHATSDMGYAEQRLGPERIKGAYAWQSLLRSGARLVIGSDAPVESLNPLLGFYAAVSRLALDGTSPHGPGGWYPGERLSRDQALRGMTLDAAYASFSESTVGSLNVGKKADFVVLSQDIMRIPFNEILTTKVKATVVDGQLVYGRL